MTIRSGRTQVVLDSEQVSQAYERVSSVSANEDTITLRGVSGGVLSESWRFDFITIDGQLISGRLHEDVTAAQAHDMGNLFDKQCEGLFKVTVFTTKAGTERRNYELLRLAPLPPPQQGKGV